MPTPFLLSVAQLAVVRELADAYLNCCSAGEVLVHTNEGGSIDLRIEVTGYQFGNFVDSRALDQLLKRLQKLGIVQLSTKVMWLGFYDRRLFIWCQMWAPRGG